MKLLPIHILTFLSVVVFFFSCQEESPITPPVTEPEEEEVVETQFDVASLHSRGVAITDANDILSMGVFAYNTGVADFDTISFTHRPNLLHNRHVMRTVENEGETPGPWTYNPVVYWPPQPTMNTSFFAYAPHSSLMSENTDVVVSAASASGYPTLRYTIPEDITEQIDLLYAAPVFNKNRLSNDTQVSDGKVHYQMKHALTWLSFIIAPVPSLLHEQYPDESYTVTWLAFMADKLTTTARLNLGTGAWTPIFENLEPVSYEFDIDVEEATNIKPGEAARIVCPGSRLMLFPFEIDAAKSAATMDIVFTYDNGQGNGEGDREEYYYFAPFPTTRMTAGNVVIYTINISTEGVSVHFLSENRIEDWLEGGDKGVEIF